MGIFDVFKKNKKVENQANFFNFPRTDEGVQKVVQWMKQASEIILDLTDDEKLMVNKGEDGRVFLTAFTNVAQHVPPYKKEDKFIVLDFKGIADIFEENMDIDFLWLNPQTDSVQLNRSVFTSHYKVKAKTEIKIGLPENRPEKVIEFLKQYAQSDSSIEAVYLALMNREGEFSYLVFIDSVNNQAIVPSIGPKVGEICMADAALYPVDFIYENSLMDETYLIYKK